MMRKRVLPLLLACVLAISLLPATPAFAAGYDLYICGRQITDANKNDVLGNGAFSFDPSTNTLTIAGDCSCSNENVIQNGLRDGGLGELIVFVANDVHIKGENTIMYLKNVKVTITGPGKLAVSAWGDATAIWLIGDTKLTVKDADLTVDDCWWAIHGADHPDMEIINSNVRLKSTAALDPHAVGGLGRIVLTDSVLVTPENGEIRSGSVYDADGAIAEEVRIVRTGELVPADCEHGHTHQERRDATCTEPGCDRIICDDCGAVVAETVLPQLGHDYVNGVCTRCGAKDPNDTAGGFGDVPQNAWFADAVRYAVERELMNGVGGGRFAPDDPMTRAMLVTVLWRYEGSPAAGANVFDDVKSGEWYTDAIAWAAANGVVDGVGSGKFDPNGKVTREQLAAILFRYTNSLEIDTGKRGNLSGFPDASKVSSWATDAYSWAVGEGLIGGNVINGKTLLDPQGNATRAQVATILMRFIQNIVT